MYSALSSEHDAEESSAKNSNRLDMLNPSRLRAAVMEAGSSLTPASWHAKSGTSQGRISAPLDSSAADTSDSDAESSFTAPSGRLNSAPVNYPPNPASQPRSIFRVSPASNRSPQGSFRLRSFSKTPAALAEDSVSLSNRSDSSSHQDHLADEAPKQLMDRRPVARVPSYRQQPLPRSAGRTRSPQRVAPAPGPSDGSITSVSGRQEDADRLGGAASPLLDIFEPRPVLSGGLEAVLGQEAQSLGSMPGLELLTHMADGLPTGKTWLRGGESLPSPSCTQPCKSRSVRKISCILDGDLASISYNRKGFHGMMQRQATGTEQVVATIFRAQITPGEWHSNKNIMVLTNRGWLALHALTNEGYVMWVLGLNAVLGLSQLQQRLYIQKCKVRDIPRSSLLMVQGS